MDEIGDRSERSFAARSYARLLLHDGHQTVDGLPHIDRRRADEDADRPRDRDHGYSAAVSARRYLRSVPAVKRTRTPDGRAISTISSPRPATATAVVRVFDADATTRTGSRREPYGKAPRSGA